MTHPVNIGRIISPAENPDEGSEQKIRPKSLDDFIGQKKIKSNLSIFLNAAKQRKEALDHVIFYGPPGLGKTTLSQIIANELGVNIKTTSGPIITKTGELAALLTNLKSNDVLFIDEIHRLSPAIEEVLYPAMEDYSLDLIIGDGPAARTVRINLPKFTLIGATTRLGMLSNPLKDRFGIPMKLDFYQEDELTEIVIRGAAILQIQIDRNAATKLAFSSRGTPRVAVRLLRRVRDFAIHLGDYDITPETVKATLKALCIGDNGLDEFDVKYLTYIAENYDGGPVGIETIAAGLSEDRTTIEDMIEPYLMQIGYIARTPRGRIITAGAYEYLKL
jgi:holliday junction DNA helicase RuvB